MKATLLLLAVFVAVSYAAQVVCPTGACVDNTKTCGLTYSGSDLTDAQSCKFQSGCGGINATLLTTFTGTCSALPTQGQACWTTSNGLASQCAYGLTCVSGTCQNYLYPGASCKTTDTCNYVSTTGLVNNCASGVCQFTPDGQNCTAAMQCNSLTSYCNKQGVCAPTVANGGDCDMTSGQCGDTQFCYPTSTTATAGKCGGWYAGAAGAACSMNSYCNGGLYCAPRSGTDTYGVCTAPAASTSLNKACVDTATSCVANAEACSCNSDRKPVCMSQANGKNVQSNWNKYASCLVKNKCLRSTGVCTLNNCKSDFCSYQNNQGTSSKCGICGSGSSVVASVFMVATFVAFLLF